MGSAFFASITDEVQKGFDEALEAGDVENAVCLLKQVSNSLGATRDMINDRILFLNINIDPGATSTQNCSPTTSYASSLYRKYRIVEA
jgi:hypothetical protein